MLELHETRETNKKGIELMEAMIVTGIVGLVIGMSIRSLYRTWTDKSPACACGTHACTNENACKGQGIHKEPARKSP